MKKQLSLAEKLEKLFEEVRKPDGSKYTQTEVIEGTHGVLTRVYLWKLRTGRATNPGFQIIQELANFFGVDPNYIMGYADGTDPENIPTGEKRFFEEVNARAHHLNDKDRKAILDMMDVIISAHNSGDKGELNRGTRTTNDTGEEDSR